MAFVHWAVPDDEPDVENSAQFTAVNIVHPGRKTRKRPGASRRP
jgi:hypothetical protein